MGIPIGQQSVSARAAFITRTYNHLMGAIVAIVASLFTGFDLGTWFSVGMIGLAGAAILYDTSNVLHHYPEDRYVSASLSLFSSVAVLFWYVLRFFMASDD